MSDADLVFEQLDADGVPTPVMKLGADKVFSVREAGGDMLGVEDIPDGGLLARSGDSVVGTTLPAINAKEVLERITTHVDITNTPTETTLYATNIGPGVLGTDRIVRLTIDGDVLQNATLTFQVRVKYGATVVYDSGASSIANSANRHAMRMQIDLYADGTTNSQNIDGWFSLGSTTAATTGTSALSSTGIMPSVIGGGGALEDSTLVKVFAVTVTWSGANPSVSFRLLHATLERL